MRPGLCLSRGILRVPIIEQTTATRKCARDTKDKHGGRKIMIADTSVPNAPIKVPCLGGNFEISGTCGPRKGAENTAPRSRMGVIAYTNGRARARTHARNGASPSHG